MSDGARDSRGSDDVSGMNQTLQSQRTRADTSATDATGSMTVTVTDGNTFYVAVQAKRTRRPLCTMLQQACEAVCDNKGFVVFGILLTVWALCGDDLRLLLTNQPSDNIFDGLICFLILFFSIEVVVSCIGKHDYFLGFFFGLDVISTATLVLDLTVVSDLIFGESDDQDTDKARSSKTARAGARVGRVVRVLRLVRIVKLFKAFQSQPKKKAPKPIDDENFDWDADFDEEDQQQKPDIRESLVGKKLSQRTTQRTIILVLSMLILLPLLSADGNAMTPASAEYGADDVTAAYSTSLGEGGNRSEYESTLLRYIFYHNWFTQASGSCPRDKIMCPQWYYSQLFWVGFTGASDDQLANHTTNVKLQAEVVKEWNEQAKVHNQRIDFGPVPREVVERLSGNWVECQSRKASSSSSSSSSTNKLFGLPLLETEIEDVVSYAAPCPKDLRVLEQERYVPRLYNDRQSIRFVFYFDLRPLVRLESQLNLMKTVFVCVVLCVASLSFSKDAHEWVLRPVEDMITKVEAIRDNPLSAITLADEEFKREELKKIRKSKDKMKLKMLKLSDLQKCWKGERQEIMETVILERTIIKLGSLLALGFGQAGVNIVRHNMRGKGNSGNVDAMIQGSRVDCIIGLAKLQDFSVVVEVLQGRVMTFVNQVAEIVHGIVDQFHGAVNKNNGDTFLVIWQTADLTEEETTRMAEMSVVAFARIIGSIHGSPMLFEYRQHPGLQQRLSKAGCRVNITFGLHSGWAIEGAVGSEFKIDASYLSPNVSIATSVLRLTRLYGVSMMVSQSVANLCTPDMAAKMRLIDRVRLEGSTKPLELYCMDLDYMSVPQDEPQTPMGWNTRQRYISRQKLAAEKSRKWNGGISPTEMWKVPQIATMRRRYSMEFKLVFGMGFQNYTEGEWQVARQFLLKTKYMLGNDEDGPSSALLCFMDSHGFQAPPQWSGIRELGNLDGIGGH